MNKKIKLLWEHFKGKFTPKNIVTFVVLLIVGLLLCIAVIKLFYTLCSYVGAHSDALIIGGCIVAGFIVYIRHKKEERASHYLQREQEQQENLELQEKARLENEYIMCRQCLFQVQRELSEATQLPTAHTPSELDAPVHYVSGNGFYIFQYLLAKGNCKLKPEELTELFYVRITQSLNRQEFSGLSQSVYLHSSGRSYPILYLYRITDNGSYYQFDMVISGKRFCDWLESSQYAKYQNNTLTSDIRDRDF